MGRAQRAPSAAYPWRVQQETALLGHTQWVSPSQQRGQELRDTRDRSLHLFQSRGSPWPRVGAFNVY